MKYINFKRYKFSTITKNLNTLRYNFFRIFKFIDLKRYDFKRKFVRTRITHLGDKVCENKMSGDCSHQTFLS